MQSLLSEHDYDRLADQTQREYIYCEKCGLYYYIGHRGAHICVKEECI